MNNFSNINIINISNISYNIAVNNSTTPEIPIQTDKTSTKVKNSTEKHFKSISSAAKNKHKTPLTEDSSSPKRRGRKPLDKSNFKCTECQKTKTPEWRKGPMGRNTLCNACGLAWAKAEKERKKTALSNPQLNQWCFIPEIPIPPYSKSPENRMAISYLLN